MSIFSSKSYSLSFSLFFSSLMLQEGLKEVFGFLRSSSSSSSKSVSQSVSFPSYFLQTHTIYIIFFFFFFLVLLPSLFSTPRKAFCLHFFQGSFSFFFFFLFLELCKFSAVFHYCAEEATYSFFFSSPLSSLPPLPISVGVNFRSKLISL